MIPAASLGGLRDESVSFRRPLRERLNGSLKDVALRSSHGGIVGGGDDVSSARQ